VLEAALDVIVLPQEVRGADEDLVEFDPEESTFQSSFSKLAASETRVEDPVPEVSDPQRFLSKELAAKSASRPGVVSRGWLRGCTQQTNSASASQLPPLMSLVPEKVAAPFAQYMASNR
jgi:exportin-2 (importin alpha re-exporter)